MIKGRMLEPVKRLLRPVVMPKLHQPNIDISFENYGSYYGGWPVADGFLDETSLVYSFGTGCDISFDVELIERFGCQVHGFDPTPIAVNWLKEQNLPRHFTFHEVGIAAENGTMSFFAPYKGDFISYSIAPRSQRSQEVVEASTKRLSTLIDELGHRIPDVIKMDIEGFEYSVLDDMIASGIKPRQLLVEFHHGMYNLTRDDTIKCVDKLFDAGYRLYFVSSVGREYAFLLEEENTPRSADFNTSRINPS